MQSISTMMLGLCLAGTAFGLFSIDALAQSELKRLETATGVVLEHGRKAVDKGFKDGERAVSTAVDDSGRAISKGYEDTRRTLSKAVDDALDGGDHFFGEVCKEICKAGCGGEENIKEKRCGCGCSAGVAVDNRGNVTGVDPTTGQPQPTPTKPSEPDLSALKQFQISIDPHGFWWISHSPLPKGFEHSPLSMRLELHRDYLTKAVPTGVVRFYMPVQGGVVREPTKKSPEGGTYWSTRRDKKYPDGRWHASFDVLNVVGTPVLAPISGRIIETKRPGTGKLTGLVIEQDLGQGRYVRAVLFYVAVDKAILDHLKNQPNVPLMIEGGKPIGTAQDIRRPKPDGYGPDMPQHVHVSLFDQSGNFLALDDNLQRVVSELVISKAKTPQGR